MVFATHTLSLGHRRVVDVQTLYHPSLPLLGGAFSDRNFFADVVLRVWSLQSLREVADGGSDLLFEVAPVDGPAGLPGEEFFGVFVALLDAGEVERGGFEALREWFCCDRENLCSRSRRRTSCACLHPPGVAPLPLCRKSVVLNMIRTATHPRMGVLVLLNRGKPRSVLKRRANLNREIHYINVYCFLTW